MKWREMIEPLVRPVLQSWWRLTRGATLGVRAIVEREDGHIVLVLHTYIPGWHLPGGGVEAGESAEFSVGRELEEEAGVELTGPVDLIGIYANHRHFRGDHVLVYRARSWRDCCPDNEGEIERVEWFDPCNPPEGTSPGTLRRLAEIYGGAGKSENW